ncbi:hypothetical protein EC988_001648 [Linderina pennispora]|nr:hypothetical protein EC988_001648 [Linderina pennispora]
MEIESADVIRLIEQFLKEHNLKRTLDVLQSESSIRLNTIDNIDAFKSNILKGRWDIVLGSVEQANLEPSRLIDLYEQVIFELAELLDLAPARILLRQTEPMQIMRTEQPERYLRLEQLLSRTTFDAQFVYKGEGTKESRRAAIAESLTAEVTSAQPSRLLTLLGQALKWQQEQGSITLGDRYDLFYGKKHAVQQGEDKVPSKIHATIKFPKKQHPESLAFSPSGDYVATGSADGFIEIWNPMTGKLRTDLKYQADSALMMMDQLVTCLSISCSGEAICSGSSDGKIKVWNVKTGACTRRIPAAHSQGVTCIAFSKDSTQVISGGFDNTVRIHGLKSGKCIREFVGHTAYITSVLFSDDMSRVVSTSGDGSVRIWDAKSASCMYNIVPNERNAGLALPETHSAAHVPGSSTDIFVCTKSPTMYIVTLDGDVKKTFSPKEGACSEFLCASITPQGKYILAVSDKSELFSFSIESGICQGQTKISEYGILGMANHPTLNMTAFFFNDRKVPIWTSE